MADFIKTLSNNDKKYNQYLQHKIKRSVSNKFLLNQLKQRNYDTNSIVEDFECFVCQKTLEKNLATLKPKTYINHYEVCDENIVLPKMMTKLENDGWVRPMNQGRCEAALIREFVEKNVPFRKAEYENELIKRYNLGHCKV